VCVCVCVSFVCLCVSLVPLSCVYVVSVCLCVRAIVCSRKQKIKRRKTLMPSVSVFVRAAGL